MVLKREEQKLVKEIKQAAAKGNTAGAKQLAKSLIRLRGQEAKLQSSMGQLRGVKTSITVLQTATDAANYAPSIVLAQSIKRRLLTLQNPQQ